MFRIRGIFDDHRPSNQSALAQVQAILRGQFPGLREAVILEIPQRLRNPMKYRFRSSLFVAEGARFQVKGFAFMAHDPELNFCFLDYLATARHMLDRGIGGALYERVRQEAVLLRAVGLFFECLPDDPALCADRTALRQNAARLRFYERYGARPIANTAYETPITPQSSNPPYLVFDDLGQHLAPARTQARAIVRAILQREYGHVCSSQYIDKVVASFQDPVIRLREPRYPAKETPLPLVARIPDDLKIALVVNDRHGIHDVRDRGYVEAPVRISAIMKEIGGSDLFAAVPPKNYPVSHTRAVHDADFVRYLKKVCESIPDNNSVYPYVFPIRNVARPPKELAIRAGYYCIDTFTPLNRRAHAAAERAVDCALTAADAVLQGRPIAYALVRPPGHHAERRCFGGFCYLNSAAIAANYLSRFGKVAILDIDYHHGNGQQDIFYERADVLTMSIHGHPRLAYPYFSGFDDERGSGPGTGFNWNLPLPEEVDGPRYRKALHRAVRLLAPFRPEFLVIALGLDTAKGDPTGTWSLRAADFEANGAILGGLRLPTLVVQEGGYNTRRLGVNARRFFWGLWSAMHEGRVPGAPQGTPQSAGENCTGQRRKAVPPVARDPLQPPSKE
ncbi:MAG: histone deacetylase family protein [Planctomycetota bacterium]|nr:histone deacetylase family protein [Planctomycetota bacterium]